MNDYSDMVEKLEMIAQTLEDEAARPTVKFNMDFWYKDDICGTACCALGLCASKPWFKERGLWLSSEGQPAARREIVAHAGLWGPVTGFSAANAFLGLRRLPWGFVDGVVPEDLRDEGVDAAVWLFARAAYTYADGRNPTPLDVAARVRDFAAAVRGLAGQTRLVGES